MNHPSVKFGLAATLVLAAPTAAALPEDRNQPIHLEASRGQLDQKTGVSVYEGNVVITQGSRPAADKPEIQGTSQRVEYDVAGAKVIMSGGARLVQGQDTFAGDRIEYDLKGDVVRARGAGDNGRIQFTIQPRTQNPLPAARKP